MSVRPEITGRANQTDRFVREPERRQITGTPTSTWYELQKADLAPKPYPLNGRTVAWSFNELSAWVEARKNGPADNWQQLGDVVTRVATKSRAR
jgi:predicted DNA-binding transcriptional regulator AlpA